MQGSKTKPVKSVGREDSQGEPTGNFTVGPRWVVQRGKRSAAWKKDIVVMRLTVGPMGHVKPTRDSNPESHDSSVSAAHYSPCDVYIL